MRRILGAGALSVISSALSAQDLSRAPDTSASAGHFVLSGMNDQLIAVTLISLMMLLGMLLLLHHMRKNSRQAGKHSEINYRELFNCSSEAIVIRDLDNGKLIDINLRFTELYGCTREEAENLKIANFSANYPPYTEAEAQIWLDKAINEGPQLFEWHARHADGRLFWVEVSLHIEEQNGKRRSIASARDITDRKFAIARASAIEHQMQQTYQSLPLALFTINAGHVVTQWNALLEQLTHTTASDMIGSNQAWRGFYHDARPCLADLILNGLSLEAIQTHYQNTVYPSKNVAGAVETEGYFNRIGEHGKWLHFTAVPLVDEAGNTVGALETLMDITERKLAEIALQNSEATYRTLIDHAPEAILVFDVDQNKFVEANRHAAKLFGYSQLALLNLNARQLSAVLQEDGPDAAAVIRGHVKSALAGLDVRFEWLCRNADGNSIPCEIHLIKLPGKQGAGLIRCSINDITERNAAQAAILRERNFLETLLDAMPIPIFYKDRDGHYLGFNDAFLSMMHLRREDILHKKLENWISPERVAFYREKDALLYQNQEKQIFQRRINENSDDPRHVIFHRAIFKNQLGEVDGMIGAILDITELENTKIALENLNQVLEHRVLERTQELHQAMEHLVQSEKLAALGNLVAGIAHELNTPIGNIVTVASTLKDESSAFLCQLNSGQLRRSEAIRSAELMQQAGIMIEHNAIRSAKLISDFKQVAVDQSSARRRLFDLEATINEVMTTLMPMLKRTDHRVDIKVLEKIHLDSYPGPIEQIITNLISNSLLHGFEEVAQGRITISAHTFDNEIILDYRDNGLGMGAETLAHLFDPFFTTKLGQGGSGLGLYIVYNLVTGVLGGRINVNSSPGAGAHFVITLPQSAP
ncbi:PAS domain S-box protein [Undibacterium sp. Jales W-56]|uniref:PAS domain-containing sensor histidine kinase n=1 Tax=Undibacterium sp. Jales W-56 TaxID=2897325 RepID=UPI0021CEEE9E|nr:PAS domain S-box protein [Undibacterium sp. Jales W-56]MCU6435150.1 PAS domain S-box protein [Undibacterium sp. Jales W-56]